MLVAICGWGITYWFEYSRATKALNAIAMKHFQVPIPQNAVMTYIASNETLIDTLIANGADAQKYAITIVPYGS